MSLKAKVTIHPMPDNHFEEENELFFPKRFHAWKLHNQLITMSFGHQTIKIICKVQEKSEEEDYVTCSHSLAKQLLLPQQPTTLSISYNREQSHMSFGPVFAVLTALKKKTQPMHFQAINDFCIELATFSQQHGLFFYVFSIDDFKDDYVSGYTFYNQMWQKHQLPLPNVIYNRIHSRKIEMSKIGKEFFEQCKQMNIPHFNERFLNKWEVHQHLHDELHLRPHLPDTKPFSNKQTILSMVENYKKIFVKPIYGSLGRHIYRITKEKDSYILQHSNNAIQNKLPYPQFSDLFTTLKRKISDKPFIIQQGIPLYEHKGRTVDFRVLCNRDYSGKWFTTSIMARLSQKENFVSNVAKGGELLKPEDVLSSFDKKEQPQIIKLLKELALEICMHVSNQHEGFFGELGVDLALDTKGNIWFIEVNVKPSKDLDGHINSTKIRPSAKAILQYGSYLAKH